MISETCLQPVRTNSFGIKLNWSALLVATLSFHLVLLFGTAGCGSKPHYKPFRFEGDPGEYLSTTWTLRSTVHIESTPTALRCEVKADPQATVDAYGGVILPANNCKEWRLDMAFTEPAAILVAYVDAYNVQKKRVARWQTTWGEKLSPDRYVHTFGSQQGTMDFKPIPSDGRGSIDKIHVFVRLKPGTQGSFEIHGVELAK